MKIDERLREFEGTTDRNVQALVFKWRKHLDIWSHQNVKPNWGQMKLSYMPVICNISVDGSTAMDIARKSMIVKQAMSRTLKELEENGMITSKVNAEDKRSDRLQLTASGKKLILDAYESMEKLMDSYKELVGEKNLEITLNVINKIIDYHEKQHSHKEDGELGD